jgi:glycerate-2-kinase
MFYQAAVRAADPGAALERALVGAVPPESVHLLAVGKAAEAMAATAVRWLDEHGVKPLSGLIVGPADAPVPHQRLQDVCGNHPQPGSDSFAAAQAVAAFASPIEPEHACWLLLSGGASSLMAGPVPGVSTDDLESLFELVGTAGLDIHSMNAVRKRFLQWGAGRLSQAIGPARWQTFAVSDVPGNVPASIGSGPTCPDEHTIADVITILERSGLAGHLPPTVEANIAGILSGGIKETLKPTDPVFAGEAFTIIASNTAACEGAAAASRKQGWEVTRGEPLTGDAAENGRSIGRKLVATSARGHRQCLILGGETVVRMGPHHGRGGRCQELALAAARELSGSPDRVIALLAAGTDGRDGPTDAAGAIVDPGTWGAIAAAGRDPGTDLAGHASHDALQVAGALFCPGLTGTNVMDIVIGLC